MKTTTKYLFLFLCVFILSGGPIRSWAQSTENQWELQKDDDGIQVYTRKFEKTHFDEFKAVTYINAPAISVLSIFKDKEDATEMFTSIKEFEQIKSTSNHQWIAHAILNISFPFDPRDMVIEMEIEWLNATDFKIHIKGSPEAVPLKEDHVRIPFVKGFWLVEQENTNKTKVTYQNVSDPGGHIPAWLVNLVTVKAPFETMEVLQELTQNNKHLLANKQQVLNKTFN